MSAAESYRQAVGRGTRRAGGASRACTRRRAATLVRDAARRRGRRDPARDRRADGRHGAVDRRPRCRPPTGTSARPTTSTASSFAGHEPLRPLVDHDLATRPLDRPRPRAATRTRSRSGPIHAGVIESGHFRFHVVGDRILHVDARLFYKHRGLEAAAEGATLDRGHRVRVARLRGLRRLERRRLRPCLRAVARARADLPPSPACARSCSSSSASGTTSTTSPRCAPASAWPPGNSASPALTERAAGSTRRSPATASCSARSRVGGSALALDDDAVRRRARRARSAPRPRRRGPGASSLFNASFQDRLAGVGVAHARRRRAARRGRARRARRRRAPTTSARQPAALATTGFEPAARARRRATSGARSSSARSSCWQTFEILDDLLDGPIEPAAAEPGEPTRQLGVGRVESPRGATSCIVERDGDRVERLHLRTGSYANWPVARARRGRTTCSPTSPSSTRASSSATPAWTADADPPPRPAPTCAATRAPAPGRAAGASPSATSTPAPATAASTSSRSPRARTTTSSASASASSPRPATPTSCSSPAPSRPACASRCSSPTRRCPSPGASPRSATARWAATCSAPRTSSPARSRTVLPVDIRIPGCPPTPEAIADALLALLDA